jgi:CheY-like chemotaxis protein
MAASKILEISGYRVNCHACRAPYDAFVAAWCSCLVTQRSLACPWCGACFCKAPAAYRQTFWSGAPKPLWDRNFEEHHCEFVPPPRPEPGDVRRPLVLVVDDERGILRVASRAIEGLGYAVVVGRTGSEGLELARRYRPELVLTDALMPQIDGREMCRRIKEDPATAGLKVVVMTALYVKPSYRSEGIRYYRADDYLTKPLALGELRALLQKHLSG